MKHVRCAATSLVLLLLVASSTVEAQAPTGGADMVPRGEEVLRQMHDRYQDTWYESFTFVQDARFYNADEEIDKVETWFESMRIPGKLRIDIWPVSQGRGILFSADVIYGIDGGQIQPGRQLVHPLLLMGFDVYRQSVEVSLTKIRGLGIDLTRSHETLWQGRDVIVIGSNGDTDTSSHQFWIDKDRLVFVRELNGPSEVQFNAWEPVGDAWVAAEVLFFSDGKMTLQELYRDMRFNVEIEEGAFDPLKNVVPAWVRDAG
jgi:hypothetical protein